MMPGEREPQRMLLFIQNISRFWMVNQLLLTKCWINDAKSATVPAENYWTDDVKMTSKVPSAADYWSVDRENLETRLCYKTKSEMAKLLWEGGNILNE